MKQNPTSDFQRCTTLMQRQCPTLKQRRIVSTLVKPILNPIGLVMIVDCVIQYMLNTLIVFILLYEKAFF